MGTVKVTNDVKKMLIAAFREIFARDSDFTYNKDDMKNSPIIITSKYAEPESENLVPQVVVSTAGYSTQNMTFYNNFYKENVIVENGVTKHRAVYANIVQFQATMDVLSTVKPECELVADKVFNAINHEYPWAFLSIGMNIRGVTVSEAVPKEQYPQYSFVSTVTISGDISIQWTEVPSPEKDIVLKNIKLTLNNEDVI